MTNLMDPLASLVWSAWRLVLEDTAITLAVSHLCTTCWMKTTGPSRVPSW